MAESIFIPKAGSGSALDWQQNVRDIQNTPPGAPAVGDRYIVDTAPTGAWTGRSSDIATWNGILWTFTVPENGWAVYAENLAEILIFDGVGWNELLTGDFSGPASSVPGNLVSFADSTGKLGVDSGVAASTLTGGPFLPLTGGALSGPLDMTQNDIIGVAGLVAATGDITLDAVLGDTIIGAQVGAVRLEQGGNLVIEVDLDGAVFITPPNGQNVAILTGTGAGITLGSSVDVNINANNDLILQQQLSDRIVLANAGTIDVTPATGQDVTLTTLGGGNAVINTYTFPDLLVDTFSLPDVNGAAGSVLTDALGNGVLSFQATTGGGDFSGPAVSIAGNIVSFADTTGKLGADSGIVASTLTGGPFLPTAGGTMSGSIDMGTQAITNAGAITVEGGSSDVRIKINTTGADPALVLTSTAQQDWSLGIDQSDSGTLKIGASVAVGANTRLTITPAGVVNATTALQVAGVPVVVETRGLTAGAGLAGGGNLSADLTFTVGANGDGSIVVNATDIQVGILATDAQHGLRQGGTQHAIAVASVSAGFISAASQLKVDNTPTNFALQDSYALGSTIAVTAANGAVAISNAAGATNNLEVSRTFAGLGNAIDVSMATGTTGRGVNIALAASSAATGLRIEADGSGSPVLINQASSLRFEIDGAGAINLQGATDQNVFFQSSGTGVARLRSSGAGDARLEANGTGNVVINAAGGSVVLQVAGSNRFNLPQNGNIAVTPGTDADFSLTTAGTLGDIFLQTSGTGNMALNAQGGGVLALQSAGSSRVRLPATGALELSAAINTDLSLDVAGTGSINLVASGAAGINLTTTAALSNIDLISAAAMTLQSSDAMELTAVGATSDIAVTAGGALTLDAVLGDVTINAGTASAVNINAGAATAGIGGALNFLAGTAGPSSLGGPVLIQSGGSGTNGFPSGTVTIKSANAGGGFNVSGAVTISAGNSTGSAAPGITTLGGAVGGNTGPGGRTDVVGGAAGSLSNGTGGPVNVIGGIGGVTTSGSGGGVLVAGGPGGAPNGNGGLLTLRGGLAAGTGADAGVVVSAYTFPALLADTFSLPNANGAAGTVLTDVVGNGVLSFQAGGVSNLQGAYAGGNAIVVTTANGSVSMSNAADITDVLALSRSFAGAGVALTIDMATGTTGNAAHITVDAGSTSTALRIDQNGGGAALDVQGLGLSQIVIGSTGDIDIDSAINTDVNIQSNGTGVLRLRSSGGGNARMDALGGGEAIIDSASGNVTLSQNAVGRWEATVAGAINVTPASGQAYTVTTAGIGDINLFAQRNVALDAVGGSLIMQSAGGSSWAAAAGALSITAIAGQITVQSNLALTLESTAGEVTFDDVGGVSIELSQVNDRTLNLTAAGQIQNGTTSLMAALNRLSAAFTVIRDFQPAETSTSGATPITKCTIVVPANTTGNDEDYIINGTALIRSSSSTNENQVDVFNLTGGAALGLAWRTEMDDDANQNNSAVLRFEFTQAAAALAQTIELRFFNDGSDTFISEAGLTAKRAF